MDSTEAGAMSSNVAACRRFLLELLRPGKVIMTMTGRVVMAIRSLCMQWVETHCIFDYIFCRRY